jgi:hypothetical protein
MMVAKAGRSSLRSCLRRSFLGMDIALNAVRSDLELCKLRLQIEDQWFR